MPPYIPMVIAAWDMGLDVILRNAPALVIASAPDIGSVIFPYADFRFFMFADEAERARRRALEGQVDSIQKRDRLDQQRTTAPLTCPEGATKIDTTHLSLTEVAEKMSTIIQSGKNRGD